MSVYVHLCHGGFRSYVKTLEVWDLRQDRRVFRARHKKWLPPVQRLFATRGGCVSLLDGRVVVHGPKAETELAGDATALGLAGDDILVATADEVVLFGASGKRKRSVLAGTGVSALTGAHRGLVLGHDEGNLEYVPASGGARRTIKSTTASAVRRLSRGPGDTVVSGHADGTVALWSLTTGRRLRHGRLHGPVHHLLLRGARLYAATELGEHLAWDLTVLQQDYCTLLDRIWSDVPVVWRGGAAAVAAPPKTHRCRRAR